jgi:hypothetical protein
MKIKPFGLEFKVSGFEFETRNAKHETRNAKHSLFARMGGISITALRA